MLACYVYLEIVDQLLHGADVLKAYTRTCATLPLHLSPTLRPELPHFARVLNGQVHRLSEHHIESSGYVVYTLEAALWCTLNHYGYETTVLAAVNLGYDTDTTAVVAAPLALLAAGETATVPAEWLRVLVKRPQIEDFARRFVARLWA